jgi:hypothetical protein
MPPTVSVPEADAVQIAIQLQHNSLSITTVATTTIMSANIGSKDSVKRGMPATTFTNTIFARWASVNFSIRMDIVKTETNVFMFTSRKTQNFRYVKTTTRDSAKRVRDAQIDMWGESYVHSISRVSALTEGTASMVFIWRVGRQVKRETLKLRDEKEYRNSKRERKMHGKKPRGKAIGEEAADGEASGIERRIEKWVDSYSDLDNSGTWSTTTFISWIKLPQQIKV